MSTPSTKSHNVPSWVNTLILIVMSIIGFLYVEAQASIKEEIKALKQSESNTKQRVIKLESDFNYTQQAIEEVKEELKGIDKKLDRLLEK